MKELVTTLLDIVGLAYWIEIKTEKPQCIYYFGPFSNREEAISAQGGYLEDLANEGAENIQVTLSSRSTPEELTIFDEAADFAVKKNENQLVAA